MTPKGFEEEKIRLSAFDHRQLAQDSEKDANTFFTAKAYANALELFIRARDSYIVYGCTESQKRCQRGIDICLVKLGKLDPEYLEYL